MPCSTSCAAPTTGSSSAFRPEPNGASWADSVAGSGIVEAQSENIAVGSPVAGVVTQVMVRVGQKVKAGDGLFCLDDREVLADLKCQEANLHAAQAQVARLENQPRREELPGAEADMREAAAAFELARDKVERERRLDAAHAVPAESLVQRERELEMARERLERAQADLKLLKAGAWKYDKEVALAAVDQARSQVERVKVQLERLTVRA